MRFFLKFWLPVLTWIVVIFLASTDLGSSAHTSRILVPVLRWINPQISAEAIEQVQTVVRKGAHLTEYAILATLALRALRAQLQVNPAAWSWRAAGGALLLAAVYAAGDEIHQSFVPSRGASPIDALIDTGGASLGLMLLYLRAKIFRARPQ